MARGLQKLQSQAKTNDKAAKQKSAHDNKKSAQAGLLFQCVVCKVSKSLNNVNFFEHLFAGLTF